MPGDTVRRFIGTEFIQPNSSDLLTSDPGIKEGFDERDSTHRVKIRSLSFFRLFTPIHSVSLDGS